MFYGDACSGVAGALHERTFAATNAVVSRLSPAPEFIVFAGDEIRGLTANENTLRAQWQYWFNVEMGWLDRAAIPLYHTTSNHTTYDAMSERVFADVLQHLPRNGPADQLGLSYFVRRGDLLLVFVHTGSLALGGEGHIETKWLRQTLVEHADARYKLVVGHHPVFSVNGFSGEYQREIGAEYSAVFWSILVEHRVVAYLCSHLLAFDVQAHEGVLQIVSAGAGTAHRMPEEDEYLHCVQLALDRDGMRYQVLDQFGAVRESLSWPLPEPRRGSVSAMGLGEYPRPSNVVLPIVFAITGIAAVDVAGMPQTFVAAFNDDSELAVFWLGLAGSNQRLTITLAPTPGRSPHYWLGPVIPPGRVFELQIALRPEMGPGGLLWRMGNGAWSSFRSACSWGVGKIEWPDLLTVGHGKGGADQVPFLGSDLRVVPLDTDSAAALL